MTDVKFVFFTLSIALDEIRALQDALDDNTIDEVDAIDNIDIRHIKTKANRIQEVAVNIPFLPKQQKKHRL